MKMKHYWTLLTVLLALMHIGCKQDKTAYIDLGVVYTQFDLSVQLEQDRLKVQNARQAILDSLELQLNVLSNNLKSSNNEALVQQFQQQRQSYFYQEKQFAEDNQTLLNQHHEQIMKQLNQYIKDFGEEKGYTFLFGANGNGNIMYAVDEKDVSEAVLQYVNDKYKGIK